MSTEAHSEGDRPGEDVPANGGAGGNPAGETRRVALSWKEGMQFEARTGRGAVTTVDGEGRLSPSPVELLLESLGACAGIDVVEILRKGRHEVESLDVEVAGRRREEAPRRYTRVEMLFRIRGEVPRKAAERAVRLSLDSYCSVYHTLAGDLAVSTAVELDGEAGGGREG